MMKWENINGVADWFGTMGIPKPTLNAYLARSTEIAGVLLLTLGLATRLISVPLIITMILAIVTVHVGNGFEIPVYYILMFFALLTSGAGKYSLDYLISKRVFSDKKQAVSSLS